jgi:hypothetical protein
MWIIKGVVGGGDYGLWAMGYGLPVAGSDQGHLTRHKVTEVGGTDVARNSQAVGTSPAASRFHARARLEE